MIRKQMNFIIELILQCVGLVIYCGLLFIYLPLFLLAFTAAKLKLTTLKIKRFLRIGVIPWSKMSLISRRSRVKDIEICSTDEEIDFIENRSFAYVKRMSFWTPWQLVRLILGDAKIPLLSDKHLAYVILHTVYAHSVQWDKDRGMFRLYMEGFEHLFLFQGFYWDARHVLVSPDGEKLIIQMDGGREYHSDCDPKDRPTFDLAKLHVQICLSYFAPGLSHNHVHFVFPGAVSHAAKKYLDHDGNLYKLLSPHFRFTERINQQALRVGKATNNKRGLDRFFFFWQPFPVTKEQFIEGVASKCKKHYVDKGCERCEQEDEVNSNTQTNEKSQISNGHGVKHHRTHTLFPPEYVTNPELYKIPYLSFLRQYYKVFEEYVKNMEHFVDESEWLELRNRVAKYVPKFEQVSFVDGVTTFLHQAGLVHFCDHSSYLDMFANQYGCMSIRQPFETFDDVKEWKRIAQAEGLKIENIMKDPTRLIKSIDVLRTRCFLDLFVDYIPNPECNVQLTDTEYNYDQSGPKMAANKFLTRLKSVDGDLKTQRSSVHIEQDAKYEHRAVGMQLVSLDKIVRTICF